MNTKQREDSGGLCGLTPHHLLPLSSVTLLWHTLERSKLHCGMHVLDGSRLGQLVTVMRAVAGKVRWESVCPSWEAQRLTVECLCVVRGILQPWGFAADDSQPGTSFFAARHSVVVAFCWRGLSSTVLGVCSTQISKGRAPPACGDPTGSPRVGAS